MTGALLQLVAVGGEDVYLIGNPQVSFFKRVYMRHTNFAIERVDLRAEGSTLLTINESKTISFKFEPHYGDLLYYTCFHIKLPEIYAEGGPLLKEKSGDQFRWVEYLGENIIEEASLIIDNKVIETIDSLYIHIANHENLNEESLKQYHKMIGHVPENYYPYDGQSYPYSSEIPEFQRDGVPFLCETDTKFPLTLNKHYTPLPTIKEQNLVIPLPFFFNKFKYLYLPMVYLRTKEVKIQIKIRNMQELYTIGQLRNIDHNRSMGWNGEIFHYNNISSTRNQEYQQAHTYEHISPKKITKNIMNFVKDKNFNFSMDIKLYSYFIFLDTKERNILTNKTTSWTIQTPVKEQFLSNRSIRQLLIKNQDLISRFHIVARRNDIDDRNQWMNFTIHDSNFFKLKKIHGIKFHENWDYRKYSDIPLINDKNIDYFKTPNIITHLELDYNGNILDVYNSDSYNLNFFERNKILHLKNIISYNFSEKPELYQPSGHLNLNKVDSFNLNLTFKDRIQNDPRVLYQFDVYVYLITFKTIKFKEGEVIAE